MSPPPLRVAVTRDEGPSGPLAEALRRRGLEPVRCPAVESAASPEPERLARAARELERYDWLVVASVRAVQALLAVREGGRVPSGLKTAAVGKKTAAELEAHGATAPLVAAEAGAVALIGALCGADRWPERRVLLPRAEDGGRELAEALRSFGAEAHEVAAYRTIERPAEAIRAEWRAAEPQAVVVASPSAARALVRAIGAEALQKLEAVVAIGATTAGALEELGVQAAVPPRADFDAAAELLSGARGAAARGART